MTLSEQQIAELKRENAAKHYRIVELEAQLEAIGAGGVEPLRKRDPVRDFPKGAIHNGRAFADRLESGDFACEAGSLAMCCDWQEFRRCFENLAEWIALQADPPAQAQEDASVVYVTVEIGGAKNRFGLSKHALERAIDQKDIVGAHVLQAIAFINAARAAQGGA